MAAPDAAAAEIVAAARAATEQAALREALSEPAGHRGRRGRGRGGRRHGLTLVNTLRGLALEPATLRPVLSTGSGGLSGPALRTVALAAVHACFRATALPIVGLGGVSTGRHALELVAAGASAVAIGTELFADPFAPARIRAELEGELASLGLSEAGPGARPRARPRASPVLPDEAKLPANPAYS